MANKKKRKASAMEPVAAPVAVDTPSSKRGRGRPPKTAAEPKLAEPASAEPAVTASPRPRGRPPRRQGSAPATPSKKSKSEVAAAKPRSSKRLSDAAAQIANPPLGPRVTRGDASGKGSIVAVKGAKGKGNAKARARSSLAAPSTSGISKAKRGRKAGEGKSQSLVANEPDADISHSASEDSKISIPMPAKDVDQSENEEAMDQDGADERNYWLMKAEPESRIEKGTDVKFSIDDLRAAKEPEGWDGVRNPTARNNMRMMLKGDLAFFYHSNCKIPGIAGIMEIVQEHSTDESALDPQHPYFDPKATAEIPKWCKVHVAFRRKFKTLIKLKELQKYAKQGGALDHMQTLRRARLSVSKVTKREWDFIMSLVDEDNDDQEEAGISAPLAKMLESRSATNHSQETANSKTSTNPFQPVNESIAGNSKSEASHVQRLNGENAAHEASVTNRTGGAQVDDNGTNGEIRSAGISENGFASFEPL